MKQLKFTTPFTSGEMSGAIDTADVLRAQVTVTDTGVEILYRAIDEATGDLARQKRINRDEADIPAAVLTKVHDLQIKALEVADSLVGAPMAGTVEDIPT